MNTNSNPNPKTTRVRRSTIPIASSDSILFPNEVSASESTRLNTLSLISKGWDERLREMVIGTSNLSLDDSSTQYQGFEGHAITSRAIGTNSPKKHSVPIKRQSDSSPLGNIYYPLVLSVKDRIKRYDERINQSQEAHSTFVDLDGISTGRNSRSSVYEERESTTSRKSEFIFRFIFKIMYFQYHLLLSYSPILNMKASVMIRRYPLKYVTTK
jgi:hypothetical protein